MRITVDECVSCGKSFSFDTRGTRMRINEAESAYATLYLPTCPHCGKMNEIAVPLSEEE